MKVGELQIQSSVNLPAKVQCEILMEKLLELG